MEKTDYKITEFHNAEFGSIRMIEDGGRLLFSGIDVAFALGYAKPRNAINVHCKGALKRQCHLVKTLLNQGSLWRNKYSMRTSAVGDTSFPVRTDCFQ